MNLLIIFHYTFYALALLVSFMMMSMMDSKPRVWAGIRQVHKHRTMQRHR